MTAMLIFVNIRILCGTNFLLKKKKAPENGAFIKISLIILPYLQLQLQNRPGAFQVLRPFQNEQTL